jgi:hypothetical protein
MLEGGLMGTRHNESPAISVATISERIVTVRGKKVIAVSDLAEMYGVATKALNQAVKRNAARFPSDFVFQLTLEEAETLRRSRSQIVTLKRGNNIKYLPYVFTEHGAIMAASVLNSRQAETHTKSDPDTKSSRLG